MPRARVNPLTDGRKSPALERCKLRNQLRIVEQSSPPAGEKRQAIHINGRAIALRLNVTDLVFSERFHSPAGRIFIPRYLHGLVLAKQAPNISNNFTRIERSLPLK